MKKNNLKTKKVVKDNNKISSYFVRRDNVSNKNAISLDTDKTKTDGTRVNQTGECSVPCKSSTDRQVLEAINVDSEEEFVRSPNKVKNKFVLRNKKTGIVKANVKPSNGTENLVNNGLVHKITPILKKRKYSEENVPTLDSNVCSNEANNGSNMPQSSFRDKSPLCNSESLVKVTPKKGTPSKQKSPSKLFSKSPRQLNEFNVQVIDNFITISPSKSNKEVDNLSSNEAQKSNEKTPTRPARRDVTPPNSKVKVKLDFSLSAVPKSCFEVKSSPNESFDLMFDDSWDDSFSATERNDYLLDLKSPQHCKIIEINRTLSRVTLILQSTRTAEKALCSVDGFWVHTMFNIGDTLYVNAVYDHESCTWCINNDSGLLVYEPDVLLSSTSVVGALFCKRRSIFSERYHGYEPSNSFMVVGVLTHSLLQHALKQKLTTENDVNALLKKIVSSKDVIKMLYASSTTSEEIEGELTKYVPRIIEFMEFYVKRKSRVKMVPKYKENWVGTIDSIQDIEENIWCPELGIKGKVDVTIKVGLHTMPLELKTGRAMMSLEHRGQVILYVMMMSKFGYAAPSGLLLYLREGVLREVPPSYKEKRDLTILRNQLAYYLTRLPRSDGGNVKDGLSSRGNSSGYLNGAKMPLLLPELPEPINHHSACEKCAYNVICCAYLRHENLALPESNRLKKIESNVLAHLEPDHIKYFLHWSSLVALESSHKGSDKRIRDIYTVPPAQREKNGGSIANVQIMGTVSETDDLYAHTFRKRDESDVLSNLLISGIEEGKYVVVSTDNRSAVSSGFVTKMDHFSVTVSLDRDLSKYYPNDVFHLDTYNSNNIEIYNMTNLALLLEASERAEKLRRLIIDRRVPTFQPKLSRSVAVKSASILRALNKLQQRAVLKGIAANDYLLIKGMPGTGKTATIVALIRLLVELDNTVLITSHTHSAVDNVCVRLLDFGIAALRLGSEARIDPRLRHCSEHVLTRNCRTPADLDKVYGDAKVLAVTCLGSGHPVLSKRALDVCIVDESTQILQCSVFRALSAAKKFILVGDPDQLPPVVRNPEAVARGLSESLFERLQRPESVIMLSQNYRMNKPITAMANGLTYEGHLEVANDTIGNAVLQIPNAEILLSAYQDRPWITRTLDNSLSAAIQILDTGPVWNRTHDIKWLSELNINFQYSLNLDDSYTRCTNPFETSIVFILVEALIKAGVPNETIGIIAPFRHQVSQISSLLKPFQVEVSTVDQFQGRDKNIILYSCTKSCDLSKQVADGKYEILSDKRRLTVAVTRAKHKFILIGDISTVRRYSPFGHLLQCLGKNCVLKLADGQLGFKWDSVLNLKSCVQN